MSFRRRPFVNDQTLIAPLDNLRAIGGLVASGAAGHTGWIVGVVNIVIKFGFYLSGAGAALQRVYWLLPHEVLISLSGARTHTHSLEMLGLLAIDGLYY